jgi:hypothetical protein
VIEEDDVGSGRPHQLQGLGDGRRLPDDQQVGLCLQGVRQARREHPVVVDDQDPDRVGCGPVRRVSLGHGSSFARIGLAGPGSAAPATTARRPAGRRRA